MQVWILEHGDDESSRRQGVYGSPEAAENDFQDEIAHWVGADAKLTDEGGMRIARNSRNSDWVSLTAETVNGI